MLYGLAFFLGICFCLLVGSFIPDKVMHLLGRIAFRRRELMAELIEKKNEILKR